MTPLRKKNDSLLGDSFSKRSLPPLGLRVIFLVTLNAESLKQKSDLFQK